MHDAQGVPIAAPAAVPVPGQPVGYTTPIMPMATATTVSTTTTVAAPYVPTYARPFELAPGRRVRLKGLIKLARLNGTTGCVVDYQPGEENKSDVVVACDADMGRRLALSVENVEMADVQVTTVAAQPMSGALAMTEPPVAFGAAGVVAGALAATYATVPMQHRPRNTCRRVAFMIACPGFFLIVGLTLLIIGSAISPDAYWRGCG